MMDGHTKRTEVGEESQLHKGRRKKKKENLSKSEGSGGKCNSSHRNPSFHLRRVA